MADEAPGPPRPEKEPVLPPPRPLPTHIDIVRIPEHVDIPIHADLPVHLDILHVHSDVAHADLIAHGDVGHIDIRHMDLPLHTDVGSSGHIDLGHGDVPVPHIDSGPPPQPPPPHVDAAPPHVDVGYNHWWQNWPKTHGYVAKRMLFPATVEEIATGVKMAEADGMPLRAVGGGWSFSDAALPGNVAPSLAASPATGRPNVSTSDSIDHYLPLAEGFPADDQPSIASIDAANGWLTSYDQDSVRHLGGGAAFVPQLQAQLTAPEPQVGYLMNTRSLKSTLQVQLPSILSDKALAASGPGAGSAQKHYFHVEAGITMDEIAALLDAQHPRLQLDASGGNPGATLAGSLATATHGAEFNTELLIDRVKAVHLVGPGGQQWWIEGSDPVADPAKLQAAYAGLDAAHIIAGTSPVNGLLPQDWLNAVIVSVGCFGVIYSVVLEVVPLVGSAQVTTQTSWLDFLGKVIAATSALQPLTAAQALGVLRNSSDPRSAALHAAIASAMKGEAPYGGTFNADLIPAGSNQYADLAFNPNAAPGSSHAPAPGDWDCWIVNRKTVPVPFDPQPPAPPGVTRVVNAVFGRLAQAFGGDTAALVLRLSQVYGIANTFHIDVPVPQPDLTVHIDVPIPALDASEHIDFSSPPISWSTHVDIPTSQLHADVPASDLHVDVPASELHVDFSVGPQHFDIPGHIDVSEHIDVQSPHIDVSQHVDVPSGELHADVPSSQLHVDVPASDFAFSQHVDLGHIDVNPFLEGLVQGATNPLALLLNGLLTFVDPLVTVIMEGLLLAGLDIASLIAMIVKIAGSSDTLDVALDTMTAPITSASALDIGQPFLTGILASTLGTSNTPGVGVSIGTGVGAIGFPASGLVGAGLEVALPVDTAFGFLQTEILDKMDPGKPFFGYVSIRLCPQTKTLLGMQQWPLSVMIEVVSFGDAWGRQFMGQLQQSVLAHMDGGNDAMLHWGLENDQLSAANLAHVPVMTTPSVAHQGSSVSKLAAFKTVRSLLFANGGANPPTLFRAFDNAFTNRMGF